MKENGFEYVDLGLPSKTMWATCNVSATRPEDFGLLFQFGRVDGYKYGDKNHKFRTKDQNKQDTGNKYTPITTSGKVYKINEILDLADDAAHVNMGGAWRMPTKHDLEELLNNTTWELETINGVKGIMFTSKMNDKQLFIPFAGWWYDGNYGGAVSDAYIWSSQVLASYYSFAYVLNHDSDGNAYSSDNLRSSAFSVRGVFKSNDTSNEHNNMLI